MAVVVELVMVKNNMNYGSDDHTTGIFYLVLEEPRAVIA